jgi:hypothetical protein
LKIFSCKYFFESTRKEKTFKKFGISTKNNPVPCNPDFQQREGENGYSPDKHLIEVHGFLYNIPEKDKRSLEIELCKIIEKNLIETK